jgi:hypothetical protein
MLLGFKTLNSKMLSRALVPKGGKYLHSTENEFLNVVN